MLINMRVSLIEADIACLGVDAVVNAANSKLERGSGVCDSIFKGAGPFLEAQCVAMGRCEVGNVVVTDGFDLPAKHIIHTVGPDLKSARAPTVKEEELLNSCYVNSLEMATHSGFETIAFPALSTGRYLYPVGEATRIACSTVRDFFEIQGNVRRLKRVVFCVSKENMQVYYDAMREFFPFATATPSTLGTMVASGCRGSRVNN